MTCKYGVRYAVSLLLVIFNTCLLFPCDCGAPGPACAYIARAKIAFVGTPVYTDEDNSGTFVQHTLYRFEVEEIFKGLPQGTKEVWIDPGSYTSCYAVYKLGVKLLVFGGEGLSLGDSGAMTLIAPGKKTKLLPPGFDPKMPVYYAPECNGTRPFESAENDMAWLRSWREGKTQTRIYGQVHDEFGFPLGGVGVTINDTRSPQAALTDANGLWSFDGIPPGKYSVSATLNNYRLLWKPHEEVSKGTCAYLEMSLQGSSSISGKVLDHSRRPLPGIQLVIARLSEEEHELNVVGAPTTSARDGSFRFTELPAGNFVIGVNLNFWPSTRVPYRETYLPGVQKRELAQVLKLQPGQVISGLQMQMPQAMRQRTVRVRVTWPDGRSVGKGILVSAEVVGHDGDFESADTDARGVAVVRCLTSLNYRLSAQKGLSKPSEVPPRWIASAKKLVTARPERISVTLVLSKRVTGYREMTAYREAEE